MHYVAPHTGGHRPELLLLTVAVSGFVNGNSQQLYGNTYLMNCIQQATNMLIIKDQYFTVLPTLSYCPLHPPVG
jgi:hypothetical protein